MTLLVLNDDAPAQRVMRVPEGDASREHRLRDLLFDHPDTLPLHELDLGIGRIVPVAKEVHLPGVGYIDLMLVSEHGRLIVVECKLWRNPQARREVVGQILDYARELARYGYEDLQRVISSRLGRSGNVLFDLIREAGGTIGEAELVDRVARDLTAGRLLLLVAGDGITEGTRRIGEYLGDAVGLAFDFGLVEVAEYRFADPVTGTERRIVQPRLLARTTTIERHVIRVDGPGLSVAPVEAGPDRDRPASSGATSAAYAQWKRFVERFVAELRFDDPGQPPPRLGSINWMRLPFPGPGLVTLWRSKNGEMGVQYKFEDAEGLSAYQLLAEEHEQIEREFADADLPPPQWSVQDSKAVISITVPASLPWDETAEQAQRAWLARTTNAFVNIFRPRLLQLTGQES